MAQVQKSHPIYHQSGVNQRKLITKMAEKPYPLGHTYQYSPYNGVPSLLPGKLVKLWGSYLCKIKLFDMLPCKYISYIGILGIGRKEEDCGKNSCAFERSRVEMRQAWVQGSSGWIEL